MSRTSIRFVTCSSPNLCHSFSRTGSLGLGRKTSRSAARLYNAADCVICPNHSEYNITLWSINIQSLQIRLQISIPAVQTAPMQLLRRAWAGALCEKFSTAMSRCSSSSSRNSLITFPSNGMLGWPPGNDSISLSWLMMIYV